MPATQHAQPPDDPAEPPRRRDHESPAAGDDDTPPCDCGGCREAAAIYAEPRREYSREQREIDRAIADERARHRGPGTAA